MPYRPTPNTIRHKQVRRQLFLDHATRIFGQKGYHDATVPMIVRAARSSTGAFYLYFRNKEDVFAAVLQGVGERIGAAIDAAIRTAAPDVLAQMGVAVTALVRHLAENPRDARILIAESSGLGKSLAAVRRNVIESHTRGVERALAALADRLPPMDTAVAARCWVGAVYEAVLRWLDQPPAERIDPEQLAAAIRAFNLRGIGAPPLAAGEGECHEHPRGNPARGARPRPQPKS